MVRVYIDMDRPRIPTAAENAARKAAEARAVEAQRQKVLAFQAQARANAAKKAAETARTAAAAAAERQRQAAAAAAAAETERQRQANATAAAAAAAAAEQQRQANAAAATAAAAEQQRQANAAAAAAEQQRQANAAAAEAERKRQQQCPPLIQGTAIKDETTGAIYTIDGGKLRWFPSPDIYASWGSPAPTSIPSVNIGNCPKGENMSLRPTLPPTPAAPTTTPAPVRLVPLPTVPELPSQLRYPSTIVTLVHRESWMTRRQLKVLTLRGGDVILAPLESRDLSQVFALGPDGSVRVLAGSGMYLATARDDGGDRPCSLVTSRASHTADSVWSLQSETFMHPLQYRLVAEVCNRPLGTDVPGFLTMTPVGDGSTSWFIIPVAKLGR